MLGLFGMFRVDMLAQSLKPFRADTGKLCRRPVTEPALDDTVRVCRDPYLERHGRDHRLGGKPQDLVVKATACKSTHLLVGSMHIEMTLDVAEVVFKCS